MNNLRRRALLSSSGGTGHKMIGNYEVVDLGLPSGLLWATCNVGATNETEYGNHYQWGAGAVTYQNVDQYYMSSYLKSSYDTATQVMGSGWRMPTSTEIRELINNTNFEFVTINGVNGAKFTSKTNSNAYVFFPAASYYYDGSLYEDGINGYVWSSTSLPTIDEGYRSYVLYFTSYYGSYADANSAYSRNSGFSVRGVHAAV